MTLQLMIKEILKEVKRIKDIVLRNIKNLFEPVRVNNFLSNDYIEYKSNGDKNRILSVEEYLDKVTPCLKDIVNDPKKSDTWKVQLKVFT